MEHLTLIFGQLYWDLKEKTIFSRLDRWYERLKGLDKQKKAFLMTHRQRPNHVCSAYFVA
jgi:hypothetical protein